MSSGIGLVIVWTQRLLRSATMRRGLFVVHRVGCHRVPSLQCVVPLSSPRETGPPNCCQQQTSRRAAPAAEAARPNSTGAASCCLQVTPAESIVSRGKQHAAPAAASLKGGSLLRRLSLGARKIRVVGENTQRRNPSPRRHARLGTQQSPEATRSCVGDSLNTWEDSVLG